MAPQNTSLNWLRVFEMAAKTSSFIRAAERLHMSAPAVSQQIKALETHLGQPLFTRSASGVSLTDEGRSLFQACSASLSKLDAVTQAFARPKQKSLIIGASLMLSIGWLSLKLPHFLKDYPDISVDLRALTGRPELPDPDMRLWIGFGPYQAGLQAERLFGESLTPVATPQIADQIQDPEDFMKYLLIEPSAHETTWADVLGLSVLPASARMLKVDNTLAALELAASGAGIALARAPATDNVLRRLHLKPCLENFSIRGAEAYHLLYHHHIDLSTEEMCFAQWLRKLIQAQAQGQ